MGETKAHEGSDHRLGACGLYGGGLFGAGHAQPLLIQGLQPGGQLTITTEVENWPGDHSVQGPDLMVRMEEHAKAMGAEVISDYITSLDLSQRPFVADRPTAARPIRPMR